MKAKLTKTELEINGIKIKLSSKLHTVGENINKIQLNKFVIYITVGNKKTHFFYIVANTTELSEDQLRFKLNNFLNTAINYINCPTSALFYSELGGDIEEFNYCKKIYKSAIRLFGDNYTIINTQYKLNKR